MLQQELVRYNGKIREIGQEHNDNIPITCPCNEHKGGFEKRPSCQVYARMDILHIVLQVSYLLYKISLTNLVGDGIEYRRYNPIKKYDNGRVYFIL